MKLREFTAQKIRFSAVLLSIAVSITSIWAADLDLYSDRPHVESIRPEAWRNPTTPSWDRIRQGLLHFNAEILALYPKDEIYFLARDGEFAYDMMRILLGPKSEEMKRIHLVNVNSVLRDDAANDPETAARLKNYLVQQGLTKQRIGNRRAIFIDTGWVGSIPEAIQGTFAMELPGQVKAHMMASQNFSIPSSRVFAEQLKPDVYRAKGDDLIPLVERVEGLPHYTSTASELVENKGILIPASFPERNRGAAEALMGDIHHFAAKKATRKNFQNIVEHMSVLAEGAKGKNVPSDASIRASRAWLEKRGINGFTFDLKDAQFRKLVPVGKGSLKFWEVIPQGTADFANIRNFKDWLAELIDQPGILPYLSDVSRIERINPATQRGLIVQLLERGDVDVATQLSKFHLGHPKFYSDPELLLALLRVFPYTIEEESIAKASKLKKVIQSPQFSEIWGIYLKEYEGTFNQLKRYALPHIQDEKVIKKILIDYLRVERGLPEVAELLKTEKFSRWPPSADILEEIINISKEAHLGSEVLMTPGWIQRQDYLQSFERQLNRLAELGSVSSGDALFTRELAKSDKALDAVRLYIKAGLGEKYAWAGSSSFWKELANAHPEFKKFCSSLPRSDYYIAHLALEYLRCAREAYEKNGLRFSAGRNSKALSGQKLSKGARIETGGNRKLTVVAQVSRGDRTSVWKVKDAKGKFFALKVANVGNSEGLDVVAADVVHGEAYRKNGLYHGEVVEHGQDYVLKRFVDGERGDRWLKEWLKKGAKSSARGFRALRDLMIQLSDRGVYLSNIYPEDLIFDGERWVLIDSSGVETGGKPDRLLAKYRRRFTERWNPKLAQALMGSADTKLKSLLHCQIGGIQALID